LREERLIALSKKKGEQDVSIKDVRPIVVKSHLAKVIEQMIKTKLERMHSKVLSTRWY
jgi:uncharacterized Fe-S cluster-containing radical SAM superfamily protein